MRHEKNFYIISNYFRPCHKVILIRFGCICLNRWCSFSHSDNSVIDIISLYGMEFLFLIKDFFFNSVDKILTFVFQQQTMLCGVLHDFHYSYTWKLSNGIVRFLLCKIFIKNSVDSIFTLFTQQQPAMLFLAKKITASSRFLFGRNELNVKFKVIN